MLCREQLGNDPLSVTIELDSIKYWAAHFCSQHTPLIRGAYSLDITISVAM
jgi:hypothetical protein